MAGWEAVCDCCMTRMALDEPRIAVLDCPHCGVGRFIGPWRVAPRFHASTPAFELTFRRPEPEDPSLRD
jgi:hypothetical protein